METKTSQELAETKPDEDKIHPKKRLLKMFLEKEAAEKTSNTSKEELEKEEEEEIPAAKKSRKEINLTDLARGIICGGCLGDAICAPFERQGRKSGFKHTEFKGIVCEDTTIYKDGRKRLAYGQVTEGAEMLMSLVRSVCIKSGKYDRASAVLYYAEWTATGAWFINNRLFSLFDRVTTYDQFNQRTAQLYNGCKMDTWSRTSLPMTRILPFALIDSDEDRKRAVIEDSTITDPHPDAVLSCVLLVEAVRSVILGTDPVTAVEDALLLHAQGSGALIKIVSNVLNKVEMDLTGPLRNYYINGLYCGLWALVNCTRFEDAMDWVVSKGGDCSNNGCIVGCVMGAKLGFRSMIEEEKTRQNVTIVLKNVNTRGCRVDRTRSKWSTTYAHSLGTLLARALGSVSSSNRVQ
jgi:ADP-ribosylglycohydrolase